MKATSSVPSGGVRPARISLGRKSAQARLSPSGKTTVKCSRFATAGHDVREAMSAPVWVLPWSAITSGAGFTSASCALKVRFALLMVMVSATAAPVPQASAAIATSDLRRCRFMEGGPAGEQRNRSYKIVPAPVCNCSGNRNLTTALSQQVGRHWRTRDMKLAIALAAAAGIALAIPTANAEETRIGVGVGPVGAGVTVGESRDRDRDRDRTTVIKEHEPRETTVIKERHEEPRDKVIIHRDRD